MFKEMKEVKHPDWEHKKTTEEQRGGQCKIGKTDLFLKGQEYWRGEKRPLLKSKKFVGQNRNE